MAGPNHSRRRFLKLATGSAAVVAAGAYSGKLSFDTLNLKLETHRVAFEQLPPSFSNYRIGFITDIHLGRFLPTDWVADAFTKIAQQHIDLLLLGGDYIWYPDEALVDKLYPTRNSDFRGLGEQAAITKIFERVADLAANVTAPDGRWGVLGNHDTWTGIEECRRAFAAHKIPLLENGWLEVRRGAESLKVVGVQDYWTGVPHLPQLPDQQATKELRVLLAHNPDYVSELYRQNRAQFDFALMGHTHGGQVRLPPFGPLYCNVEDLRLAHGFIRSSKLISYTSRGLGIVEFPYRINCPPEVTIFELVGA
ncbi:MAG: metallophosphoesterase [Oligoflexia bacterium]|nr:metallophosphoesterase [Oligoflexia bacterium]